MRQPRSEHGLYRVAADHVSSFWTSLEQLVMDRHSCTELVCLVLELWFKDSALSNVLPACRSGWQLHFGWVGDGCRSELGA